MITSIAALFYYGILHFNNPSYKEFPIRGVDVSSYQGEIDWSTLSQQNINFAYIKATEGSSLQDKRFDYNFTEALKAVFSFGSPAISQFENIIKTVPRNGNMLPIAVDVEFYAGNDKNPPQKETVTNELNILLRKLTLYYGKEPNSAKIIINFN